MRDNGIVAAAIRIGGITISMPRPARHGEILWSASSSGISDEALAKADQGFLDHRGLFLDRKTARIVAVSWNQLIERAQTHSPELFSEDVW